MDFPIGFKVRLVHTGQIGAVVGWLSDGMVKIEVEGDVLPVFVEDIVPVRSDSFSELDFSMKTAPKKAEPPSLQPLKIMGGAKENRGCAVVFEPVASPQGPIERYRVWLANDSPVEAIFSARLCFFGKKETESEGKLTAHQLQPIGSMLADQLNDSLEVELDFQRISTKGVEPKFSKQLKIRAKNFFSSFQPYGPLLADCHVFSLFETWPDEPVNEPQGENLADFAKKLTKKPARTAQEPHRLVVPNTWLDPLAKAEFESELDLHIEKLTSNFARLQPHEIVQLQMRRFDSFMAEAVRFGLDQVFIIHGLGAGRLKNLVHQRLRNDPNVAWFRNEWHKKYGYGATEVIFK